MKGWGVKEFGLSLETQKNKLLAGYPAFWLGYPGDARKVCVQCLPPPHTDPDQCEPAIWESQR